MFANNVFCYAGFFGLDEQCADHWHLTEFLNAAEEIFEKIQSREEIFHLKTHSAQIHN
jgi:hypothetical protein